MAMATATTPAPAAHRARYRVVGRLAALGLVVCYGVLASVGRSGLQWAGVVTSGTTGAGGGGTAGPHQNRAARAAPTSSVQPPAELLAPAVGPDEVFGPGHWANTAVVASEPSDTSSLGSGTGSGSPSPAGSNTTAPTTPGANHSTTATTTTTVDYCYVKETLGQVVKKYGSENVTKADLTAVAECKGFKSFADACNYVQCTEECAPDGGFIDYLRLTYCSLRSGGLGMLVFVVWVLVLFVALGAVAEEFFCPALSVISDTLGLSENVAGVTFLAFGNGAPDISSVYSSFMADSTSLAIGELYGSGLFVTTVVVGVISIVVPFKLTRRPFIRDVLCYLIAAVWSYGVLWDGKISLTESIGLLSLYVFYVAVVVVGRRIYQSRKRRRLAKTDAATSTSSLELGSGDPDSELSRKREQARSEALMVMPSRRTSVGTGLNIAAGVALAVEDAIDHQHGRIRDPMRADVYDDDDADLQMSSPQFVEVDAPAARAPIYEDEEEDRGGAEAFPGAADRDDELLLEGGLDDDDELLDADQPLVKGGRSAMLRAKVDPWVQLREALNPLDLEEFLETTWYWKIYALVQAPITFAMTLTIPVVDLDQDDQNWRMLLTAVQCVAAPLFILFGMNAGTGSIGGAFPVWALGLVVGAAAGTALLATARADTPPRWYTALAFVGFLVAIVWIKIVADEIVNVLTVIGQIVGISPAILGLTVLAWGNSIGDFVSNLTVAKQGFPQMAVGASFGGPALNMLLGIGISGTAACATKANPFVVESDLKLKVSGGFLIASLISSLVMIPSMGFKPSKRYGYFLLSLYVVFMAVALYVEISGVGS